MLRLYRRSLNYWKICLTSAGFYLYNHACSFQSQPESKNYADRASQ
jgi:hypothetical protein